MLLYLGVEFDIDGFSLLVNHLKCVTAVTVHVTVTVRCTSVREQERHLVTRLWAQCDKVPEHVSIL